MNKIISLLFVWVFVFVSARAQSFEGKIVYQNSYKSKIPNVSDQQFSGMMGTAQDYFLKDGNYKIVSNGTFFQWQIYVNADNKLYSKLSSSASLFYHDGSINPDEVMEAEINKGVTTILGYVCDELVLTCKTGVQRYYYSSKLPLEVKWFENFKFGNWYEFVSRAKAVPLKMIIDNPQFTLESVATAVKAEKLEAALFALPPGVKIEKSPF